MTQDIAKLQALKSSIGLPLTRQTTIVRHRNPQRTVIVLLRAKRAAISTMSIGQELMHQNNVFQTTTGQVLAKPKIGETDGRDVFFAVGLASKHVPEVLLFVQYRKGG